MKQTSRMKNLQKVKMLSFHHRHHLEWLLFPRTLPNHIRNYSRDRV